MICCTRVRSAATLGVLLHRPNSDNTRVRPDVRSTALNSRKNWLDQFQPTPGGLAVGGSRLSVWPCCPPGKRIPLWKVYYGDVLQAVALTKSQSFS